MARQSRKRLTNEATTASAEQFKVYRTALYCRLSTEDPEEQTIDNQLELLRRHIAGKPQFLPVGEYIDNGFTGTNFDRPDFQRLLDQIRAGSVDCIIVKDLSRLGRNYIETGTFLEKVCPLYGLRVIAINDRFDSLNLTSTASITMSLANVMNDLYAKDISRKASSALQGKMERGEYIGNYAPYGYCKDPKDKNHLIPNPDQVEVVRRIFQMRAEGIGVGTIAATLNRENIPSPGRYRYEHGIHTNNNQKGAKLLWGRHVLNDLLRNVVYIGNLSQARCRQALYRGQGFRRTMPEEWVTVENTHEAIISKELFAQVQAVNEAAEATYHANHGKYEGLLPQPDNPFGKRLVCADCGSVIKLVRSISTKKDRAYFTYKCAAHVESQGLACSDKSVRKEDLDAAVLATIQLHIQLFLQQKAVIEKLEALDRKKNQRTSPAKDGANLEKRLRQREHLLAELYMDLKQNLISDNEYQAYRTSYRTEIEGLRQKLAELQAAEQTDAASTAHYPNWSKLVAQYRDVTVLSKELVEAFVQSVQLHEHGEIEVTLNYMDEFAAARELCQRRGKEVA